jgi:triosephosphate isomerase
VSSLFTYSVGETLTEFEKNLAGPVCAIQLKKGLAGVSAEQVVQHVCIAYEPVWAIGTGKVATPEIAQEVHATCRGILAEMYGWDVANQIRILYGGSVGPDSVDGLMAKPDIDGALVGGASLSAEKFGRIINYLPLAPVPSPAASRAQELPAVEPTLSRLGRLTNSIKKILRKVV